MRYKKRKTSIAFLLTGILVIMNVLFGCGSSGESTTQSAPDRDELVLDESNFYDPSKIITITGWFEDEYTQNLMAYLAEKYPDYDFEYHYISKTSYEEITDSKLASKYATDIVMVNPAMAKRHGQNGYLVNLTQYCEEFTENAKESFMHNGEIYAIPSTSEYQCTFYNRTIFENSGQKMPSSFAGYLDLCDYIQNKMGIKPLSVGLKDPERAADSAIAYLISGYLASDQGKTFGERLARGEASFSKELQPALTRWREIVSHKILTKEMCIMDSKAAIKEFAQEESFMYIGSVEDYNQIMELNPNIRIGTVASFSERKGFPVIIGGCNCGFAVNIYSKNISIATEIVADLATEEGQRALWRDRMGSRTYLKDVSFENPSTFDGLRPTLSAGRVFSPWNEWGEYSSQIYNLFGEEMQRVIAGDRTIEVALKVIDDKVKTIQKQN